MKLERVTGPATILQCNGCFKEGVGGSEPYVSASRGTLKEPEEWYLFGYAEYVAYCSECAAKITQKDDAASVNVFYTDTKGTNQAL